MMENFRSSPPETIDNADVVLVHDYLKRQTYDTISHLRYDIKLPKSNVLQYIAKNGTKVSIRPSGTEPKIKFYFSVNTPMNDKADYDKLNEELGARIENLKKDLGLE